LFFHEQGREVCNDCGKSKKNHKLYLEGSIEIIACYQKDNPPEPLWHKVIDADNDEKKYEKCK